MKFETLTAAAVVFVISGPMAVPVAQAESFTGICVVNAGTVGSQKYATLKCYKQSEPGNYTIRSTIWERDNSKAYLERARLSRRRYTCTFTRSGSSLRADARYTNKKMNCR